MYKNENGFLTQMARKQLKEDFKNGMSITDLSRKYKVAVITVRYHIKGLKQEARPVRTTEYFERMRNDYATGMPVKQIAEKYKVAPSTVYHYTNIKMKPDKTPMKPYKKIKKLDATQKRELFRRFKAGEFPDDIAKQTGIILKSVNYYRRQYEDTFQKTHRNISPTSNANSHAHMTKGKPFAFPFLYLLYLLMVAGLLIDAFMVYRYLGY